MKITMFVLFYMIQAWTKEYWEKNKKTFSNWKSNWLAGSFITKSKGKAQIFPYITFNRHWTKGTYLTFL